jgi:hypothetical protein
MYQVQTHGTLCQIVTKIVQLLTGSDDETLASCAKKPKRKIEAGSI